VLFSYPFLGGKHNENTDTIQTVETVDRNDRGQIYYVYNKEGQLYSLRYDEVLHIPGLGFDGLIGYSPIAMAKNAIGMAIATEEYGAKFFANGANLGGVLEHPGIVKDPARVRL
jgi:phage portal protein BeeE